MKPCLKKEGGRLIINDPGCGFEVVVITERFYKLIESRNSPSCDEVGDQS